MSSITMILMWLAVSIVIILITILKFKLNPTIALVIGSVVMGLGTGLGLVPTADAIGKGFGNLMVGIGLPIGFGVILGQLLSDCGGARVIAKTLIQGASPKYALYAIGLTGFILSIPVFFDITFIILIPLAVEMSRQIKKPLPYAVGAVVIGGMTAHTLVPPTPNPLAAASILNFDLGLMIIVGGLIGLVCGLLAMKLYFTLLDRGFWNSETDETGNVQITEDTALPANAPSFFMALIPIVLPVVLIILSTVSGVFGVKSEIINFLSNKNIAMLLGALAAYGVASKALDKKSRDHSANTAMKDSGCVLLVTGAGGSFGAIISATGFADALKGAIGTMNVSPLLIVLIAYGVAVIFRVSLGSGTVASITTMTIMANIIGGMSITPVWVAIACLAGGMSIGHVNDSAFWVVTNMSGYSVKGGFKSYTIGAFMVSIMALICAMIGSIIF